MRRLARPGLSAERRTSFAEQRDGGVSVATATCFTSLLDEAPDPR